MSSSTTRVWDRSSDRRLGLSRLLAGALELLETSSTPSVRRASLERDISHLLKVSSVEIKEVPQSIRVGAVRERPGVVTTLLPGFHDPPMAIEIRTNARELDTWSRQSLGDLARVATLVLSSGPEGRGLSGRTTVVKEGSGCELVGTSPKMTRLRHEITRMAEADFTVLVEGESGSGKELVARLVHERSSRHAGPFIGVNCAALVETLLEAELFGIEDRAATGVRGRRGKFELAVGGTLFLDEVSDLSPAAQAKLLRAIQERTVERVGGHTTRAVNTRIVVATNQSLRELVSAGRFRADLFYRLSGVEIHVPPLRARRGDIALLTQHFLEQHRALREISLSSSAMDALLSYSWPGNVRELERVIERAVALASAGTITLDDLPPKVTGDFAMVLKDSIQEDDTMRTWGSRYARIVLERCANNKRHACRVLGISYHTLQAYLSYTGRSVDVKSKAAGVQELPHAESLTLETPSNP